MKLYEKNRLTISKERQEEREIMADRIISKRNVLKNKVHLQEGTPGPGSYKPNFKAVEGGCEGVSC